MLFVKVVRQVKFLLVRTRSNLDNCNVLFNFSSWIKAIKVKNSLHVAMKFISIELLRYDKQCHQFFFQFFFTIFATLEAISKMMSNRVFFQDAFLNKFPLCDVLENCFLRAD